MHLAVAVCGTWLALGASVIQVMVTAATVLDAVIAGEELNYVTVSKYLLRMDAMLGCIVIPISVLYTASILEGNSPPRSVVPGRLVKQYYDSESIPCSAFKEPT